METGRVSYTYDAADIYTTENLQSFYSYCQDGNGKIVLECNACGQIMNTDGSVVLRSGKMKTKFHELPDSIECVKLKE